MEPGVGFSSWSCCVDTLDLRVSLSQPWALRAHVWGRSLVTSIQVSGSSRNPLPRDTQPWSPTHSSREFFRLDAVIGRTLILNSIFFWILIICSVRLIFRTPSLQAFTTWARPEACQSPFRQRLWLETPPHPTPALSLHHWIEGRAVASGLHRAAQD